MKTINANGVDYRKLNSLIRDTSDDVCISSVCGQRFISAGLSDRNITLNGTPGNALGAYLNGANITVYGNAQDAVGDTMNDGCITVHGNIGDAAGYAMRGGSIYVKGNAGYRAGIHMKEYNQKRPVMVVGGSCGSFLGEYQAGGIIIVLGLNSDKAIVSNFACTGMHGGKVFLRGELNGVYLPKNVIAAKADSEDMNEIYEYLSRFCELFDYDLEALCDYPFTKIVPDSKNPYKQMYVAN